MIKKVVFWLVLISILMITHLSVAYYATVYAYGRGHDDGAQVIIDSLFQTCLQHGVLFTTPFGDYRCTMGGKS